MVLVLFSATVTKAKAGKGDSERSDRHASQQDSKNNESPQSSPTPIPSADSPKITATTSNNTPTPNDSQNNQGINNGNNAPPSEFSSASPSSSPSDDPASSPGVTSSSDDSSSHHSDSSDNNSSPGIGGTSSSQPSPKSESLAKAPDVAAKPVSVTVPKNRITQITVPSAVPLAAPTQIGTQLGTAYQAMIVPPLAFLTRTDPKNFYGSSSLPARTTSQLLSLGGLLVISGIGTLKSATIGSLVAKARVLTSGVQLFRS